MIGLVVVGGVNLRSFDDLVLQHVTDSGTLRDDNEESWKCKLTYGQNPRRIVGCQVKDEGGSSLANETSANDRVLSGQTKHLKRANKSTTHRRGLES